MNADRLEELARIAEAITTEGYDPSLSSDLRDLARCARAWAKVEGTMLSESGFVELFGYAGRKQHWSWYPTSKGQCKCFAGHTAIEAVEAAEGRT